MERKPPTSNLRYPWEGKFKTKEEINEYLIQDGLTCFVWS